MRSEVEGPNGKETLWTFQPKPAPGVVISHETGGELTITRLGVDPSHFSLLLRADRQRLGAIPAEVAPTLVLTVDGCPALTPELHGLLRNDGSEGRLTIARAALPLGDLQLIFEAFNDMVSLYVRHRDNELEPISAYDLKTTVVRPADPAAGLLETVTFLEPNCAGQ